MQFWCFRTLKVYLLKIWKAVFYASRKNARNSHLNKKTREQRCNLPRNSKEFYFRRIPPALHCRLQHLFIKLWNMLFVRRKHNTLFGKNFKLQRNLIESAIIRRYNPKRLIILWRIDDGLVYSCTPDFKNPISKFRNLIDLFKNCFYLILLKFLPKYFTCIIITCSCVKLISLKSG